MNCSDARVNLIPLIRHELSPDEATSVREHLAGCKECPHEIQDLSATIDALRTSVPSAPPSHLRAVVLGAIEGERVGAALRDAVPALPDSSLRERALAGVTSERSSAARWKRNLNPLVAVAAALAILFAVGGWLRIQSLEANVDQLEESNRAASSQLGPEGHEMQTFALEGTVGEVEGRLTHYRHDNFRITLEVGAFGITPPDTYYAVWLRGEKGDVPIGTFRLKRADRFVVSFAAAVDPVDYPEVVVSLEPDDGDPLLTGSIVARGALDTANVHHGRYED